MDVAGCTEKGAKMSSRRRLRQQQALIHKKIQKFVSFLRVVKVVFLCLLKNVIADDSSPKNQPKSDPEGNL